MNDPKTQSFIDVFQKVYRPILMIFSSIIMFLLREGLVEMKGINKKQNELSEKMEYQRGWIENTDKRLDNLEQKTADFEAFLRNK